MATTIDVYEPLWIPGLLQIEDYIRHAMVHGVVTRDEKLDDTTVEHQTAFRLERQAAVLDLASPIGLRFVLSEAALRSQVGGEGLMARQIDHLQALGRRGVDIRYRPYAAGVHGAMSSSFVVMDFSDELDPPIIYAETLFEKVFSEKQSVVRRLKKAFEELYGSAVPIERFEL